MGQSNVVIIAGPITFLLVGMTYRSPVRGIISRVTSFCTHRVISIWFFGSVVGPVVKNRMESARLCVHMIIQGSTNGRKLIKL